MIPTLKKIATALARTGHEAQPGIRRNLAKAPDNYLVWRLSATDHRPATYDGTGPIVYFIELLGHGKTYEDAAQVAEDAYKELAKDFIVNENDNSFAWLDVATGGRFEFTKSIALERRG